MDHASKFAEFFGGYGYVALGPTKYDPGSCEGRLLDLVRSRAEMMIDDLRVIPAGSMPHVYFGFLDSHALNAYAAIDGIGLIGMTSGLVFLLYDTFYRILSHPRFQPLLGDSAAESVQPFHESGLFADYGELMASRRPADRRLDAAIPRDRHRAIHAEYLATICIDFVVAHEMGHIRNGHCGHIRASRGTRLIAELCDAGVGAESLPSQAMEMDADSYAAISTLTFNDRHMSAYRRDAYATVRGLAAAGIIQFEGRDPNCILFVDVITSYFIFFSLFNEDFDLTNLDLESSLYPHPILRRCWTGSVLIDWVAIVQPDFCEAHVRSLKFAFQDAINGIKLISSGTIPAHIIDSTLAMLDERVANHLSVVKREWSRIRPELLKYSFAQDLAP